MVKVKLNQSILGWMLVPMSDDAKAVLSELYGTNYDNMKPLERAFMKGERIDAVLAHVKTVAKELNIGLSVCGKPYAPTLRLWYKVTPAVQPTEEKSVDLKWSCWSTDESVWGDYAPGTWERMEQAFNGTASPLKVASGPRKEIRYGSVVISKGKATGYFVTEWDSVDSLADTLGTEPDEGFNEMIPHSPYTMEPGMDWDFTVKAKSFRKLMARIDAEEDRLLETDRMEWESIKACFTK